MKHRPSPAPTFAQFQLAHQSRGARLVWLANCGMTAASAWKAVITHLPNGSVLTALIKGGEGVQSTLADVGSLLAYTCFNSLPYVAIRSGRIDWVQAACTMTGLCISFMLWCTGVGWLPEIAGIKLLVSLRLDVVIELVYLLQNQMSLPLVAVLYALRQVGWQATAVWRLGGSLQSALARGAGNWMLLMAVAWMIERRLRCQYQKLYPSRQQEPEQQPEASSSRQCCWDTASDLPVGMPGDDGSTPFSGHDSGEPGGVALLNRAGVTGEAAGAGAAVEGEPAGDAAGMPGRSSCAMAGHSSTTLPSTLMDDFIVSKRKAMPLLASGSNGKVMVVGSKGSPSIAAQQRSVLEQLRLSNLSYKRSRPYTGKSVCVKIQGVELEQLPQDLPRLLHEQLSHCMPGVTMSALALRSGCVMMTMDLMCPVEADETTLADDTRRLIGRLMQDHSMGHVLGDGATMSIQVADGLSFCRWDSDASTYTLESVSQTLDALGTATLTNCRIMRAFPAVQCWADTAMNSRQLTLTVELELPSNCQLHGWQPAGAAAPAGSTMLRSSLQDDPALNAMLLARRLDGGYLRVVVEQVSHNCMGKDDQTTHRVSAQAVVTMDGASAAALRLELWFKDASQLDGGGDGEVESTTRVDGGTEVLVSHIPLLVLTSSWKEAAAELQQHVTDVGGVPPRHATPPQLCGSEPDDPEDGTCTLLEDLGTWLTHQQYSSSHTEQQKAAASDGVMSGTGDDLLVYAVQAGLGAVADMIVDTMQRSEQQGPASGACAWLSRAARGSEGTSVLHAAMLSGKTDILARVVRWGSLYGGPDWAWPWELEDATGCTALHLAAAQPAAGACAALLKTITCMLAAVQMQAVRSAWIHCQGRVGVTPAGLLDRTSPASRNVWGSEGPSQITSTDAGSCSRDARRDTGESSSPATSHPDSAPIQVVGTDQSWLHSMAAVWRLRETDEYRAWAQEQMRHISVWWVVASFIVVAVCMYRSALKGCVKYEFLHILLQGFASLPMVAITSCGSWLNKRQAWLLSPHMLYCCAYYAKARLPSTCMPLWIAAGTTGAESLFVIVFDAPMDQAALPHILVMRSVMAYLQSLAYQVLGVRFCLLRAVLTQLVALVVTTVCRARQQRAYHRWHAARGRSGPSAGGKRGQREEQHEATGLKKYN